MLMLALAGEFRLFASCAARDAWRDDEQRQKQEACAE
jgi:hypothetical protein